MRPRALVVRSGAKAFSASGAAGPVEVVERVSHRIERVEPPEQALRGPFDVAIVTSRSAVAEGLAGDKGRPLRQALASARVVAVGPATAEALREAGIEPADVAAGSGAAVLERLAARLDGRRILLPCGEDADGRLPAALEARGASVSRCVLYRKIAAPPDPGLAAEVVARPFAAFAATSPAAVRWLWDGLGEAARARLRETPAVALGPSTRAALESRGVARVEVAGEPSFAEARRLLAALAAGAPGK
ncbi:MAG TPA: uroporphyrinogen-III synthase [Thermoanaerobaculia bacterium]|nr:uroporphyrinogen-III synthase [Thermoanaerobaculia bacterium]